MSGVKISGLPITFAAQYTDILPEVQTGVTKQVNLSQVASLFGFSNGVLQPSAGGTGVANGASYSHLSVPMTAAQWNGMYAAPYQIIPAAGANTLIYVNSAIAVMTYGTTDYANGGNVAFQYGNTVHGAGLPASDAETGSDFYAAASTSFAFMGVIGPLPFSTSINTGIYLSNASAAFTAGDSIWDINIYYTIVSVA